MNWSGFAAVGIGAALGAWLRWGLSSWLNPVWPQLPMGTLAANIGGAYVIGLAIAGFGHSNAIGPEMRLFLITGLLGALTTFSTFSAESVLMLQRQMYGLAALHMLAHLGGSLAATFLGIWSWSLLRGS